MFGWNFLKPEAAVRKKQNTQAEKLWHILESSGIWIHYFSLRTLQDAMFFQPAASYNFYA